MLSVKNYFSFAKTDKDTIFAKQVAATAGFEPATWGVTKPPLCPLSYVAVGERNGQRMLATSAARADHPTNLPDGGQHIATSFLGSTHTIHPGAVTPGIL